MIFDEDEIGILDVYVRKDNDDNLYKYWHAFNTYRHTRNTCLQ